MPALEIALLGPFAVRLVGERVSPLATLRGQALLAYLAVEAAHPHSREALAGLLWPEQPEALARLSLRQTLFKLRRVIPPVYLSAARHTLQFNPHSDYSLDVTTFTNLIGACRRHPHTRPDDCAPCMARQQAAVALYQGDFLADFFLADSAAFEEWALLKREWLRREALHALYHLAAYYQQQGDAEAACPYAWRQVELDPLREEAYQQLMSILAMSGRRSEAVQQYQVYRQRLAAELAAEPGAETTVLYERIRAGDGGRSSARYFRLAGQVDQTIDYLHQAGKKAVADCTNYEAVILFNEALTLLKTLPETPAHLEQELSLQVDLGNVLLAIKGYAAAEVEDAFGQARALCGRVGETPQLFRVMHGLFRYYLVRGAIQTTRELGRQIMDLTRKQTNPDLLLPAELCLGITAFFAGEFAEAQAHFSRGAAFYNPRQQQADALLFGQDATSTCLTQSALALWHLGYPDLALNKSREAVVSAQLAAHPFSLALTFSYAGWLHQLRREVHPVQIQSALTISFSESHGFVFWSAMGLVHDGWRLTEQGAIAQGLSQIRRGLATWQATGADLMVPYFLGLLAEAYGKNDQVEQALKVLTDALAVSAKSQERNYEAELYRLKGEFLRQQGRLNDAAKCFHQAITIADRQGSQSLELRAVMSLGRLWREQGRPKNGYRRLAEVYRRFSEGWDTPDLQTARQLLLEWA